MHIPRALNYFLTIFLFFFYFGNGVNLYSQSFQENDPYFAIISKDVTSLIEVHYPLLQNKSASFSSTSSAKSLEQSYSLVPKSNNLQDSIFALNAKISKWESKKYQRDIGVKFNGSFVNNFSDGFEELGFFYRRGLTIGVDWNVFQNGLYQNLNRSKELKYRLKIDKTLYQQSRKSLSELVLSEELKDNFAKTRKSLLIERKQFVNEYFNISKKLYSHKLILWDEILKVMNTQMQVELALNSHELVSLGSDSLFQNAFSFPVLALRPLSALLDTAGLKSTQDSLKQWEMRAQRLKYHPLHDLNVKPFLRYSYYDYTGINSNNRDFLSAGVNVSFPIPYKTFENKKIAELNSYNRILQYELKTQDNFIIVQKIYEQYNEKYAVLVELIFREMMVKERIRREYVKKEMNDKDFSPIYISRQMNDWYQIKTEMLDVQQELYAMLARLKWLLSSKSIEDITYIPQFDVNKEELAERNMTVYIWSETFKNNSNAELLTKLKSMGCNRIVISINHDNELKVKLLEWMPSLTSNRISVEMMIGNNELIYTKNNDQLVEEINYLKEIPGIAGIHLDIEPHAMPELKANRENYQNLYVKMLTSAKTAIGNSGLELNVSIPSFYSETTLTKITSLANKLYIMAYERPEVEFIKRKIQEESRVASGKVVIALSAKDFLSRSELKEFSSSLKLATGITEFAIHDFKGFENLK